jgi:hypothetical protein
LDGSGDLVTHSFVGRVDVDLGCRTKSLYTPL